MGCLAIAMSLFTGVLLIAFLTGVGWQRLVATHPSLIDDGGPTELYEAAAYGPPVLWEEE